MNYYQAREMKADDGEGRGLWHYTCKKDGRTWPVGPCAEGCPGHPSEAEARQHYTAWATSGDVVEEVGYVDWTGCRAETLSSHPTTCDTPTKQGLHGRGLFHDHDIPLCDEHRDPEKYAGMVGTIGNVTASW